MPCARRGRRRAVWVDCLVLPAGASNVCEGVVTDLSSEGLWLELAGPAPQSETMSVSFTPPGWDRVVTARARVLRVSEGVDGSGLALSLELHPSLADELGRSLDKLPPTLPTRAANCQGPVWVTLSEPELEELQVLDDQDVLEADDELVVLRHSEIELLN